MARLWTDLIDPATLTGFARRALQDYETAKGTLARWLPNQQVDDISVRFVVGSSGLVDEARYRAFDAEPEFGRTPGGKRVTVDLVALSQQGIISERDQLRLRKADDDVRRKILTEATRTAVLGIADRVERQRASVLVSGQAVIAQDNYADSVDFGRDPSMNVTAPTLWSDPAADRIGYLSTLIDQYVAMNGDEPGAILTSKRVWRALSGGSQFGVQLVGGGSRPANDSDVRAILAGAGIPDAYLYDRRGKAGRFVPDDRIMLLPAPVDPNSGTSELGATFWGETLAASEPEYGIEQSEQPGIVSAAFTNEGIPPVRHTYVDSLNLPVGANMNLSLVAKVL